MQTIYLDLTKEFNRGQLRAVICSGQAVVLHQLAVMSKDGDWIVREEREALDHILQTLAAHGSRYRFGAPLDIRWMAGGWSSHFEFKGEFRVRTDFFTRPPRLSSNSLKRIWKEQDKQEIPFLDPPDLAEIKKTNREKDYVVIGELGRLMKKPSDQILYSRSARDIIRLADTYPQVVEELIEKRPLLKNIGRGEDEIARALDEERRGLIRKNEIRLQQYMNASREWHAMWSQVNSKIVNLPLAESHRIMVEEAEKYLPYSAEDHNESAP